MQYHTRYGDSQLISLMCVTGLHGQPVQGAAGQRRWACEGDAPRITRKEPAHQQQQASSSSSTSVHTYKAHLA